MVKKIAILLMSVFLSNCSLEGGGNSLPPIPPFCNKIECLWPKSLKIEGLSSSELEAVLNKVLNESAKQHIIDVEKLTMEIAKALIPLSKSKFISSEQVENIANRIIDQIPERKGITENDIQRISDLIFENILELEGGMSASDLKQILEDIGQKYLKDRSINDDARIKLLASEIAISLTPLIRQIDVDSSPVTAEEISIIAKTTIDHALKLIDAQDDLTWVRGAVTDFLIAYLVPGGLSREEAISAAEHFLNGVEKRVGQEIDFGSQNPFLTDEKRWWEYLPFSIPIFLLISIGVAIWGYFLVRAATMRRATLDLIEQSESSEYYRQNIELFSELVTKGHDVLLGTLSMRADRRVRDRVLAHLNHFELIAIGIEKNILDKKFYEDWMKSGYLDAWAKASDFIQQARYIGGRRNKNSTSKYVSVYFKRFENRATIWGANKNIVEGNPIEVSEDELDDFYYDNKTHIQSIANKYDIQLTSPTK